MMASSSAMTTRLGRSGMRGARFRVSGAWVLRGAAGASGAAEAGPAGSVPVPEPEQQLVLPMLELVDGVGQSLPGPGGGVGRALGVVVVVPGHRGLGHERPEPGVVGGV